MIDLQVLSTAPMPNATDIEPWIQAALSPDIKYAEITVRIVDEAESAQLNQTYRHKQGPTNILSFNYDPLPESGCDLLGDLVICAPVVAREAREQNKTLLAHWAHLIVHGSLHLQGYDHIKTADAEIMENKERQILAKLGFQDPYEGA